MKRRSSSSRATSRAISPPSEPRGDSAAEHADAGADGSRVRRRRLRDASSFARCVAGCAAARRGMRGAPGAARRGSAWRGVEGRGSRLASLLRESARLAEPYCGSDASRDCCGRVAPVRIATCVAPTRIRTACGAVPWERRESRLLRSSCGGADRGRAHRDLRCSYGNPLGSWTRADASKLTLPPPCRRSRRRPPKAPLQRARVRVAGGCLPAASA